uniref:Uncharacterized protein n=1 Tax=Rhodopseudomonas palustris (strain BisA53) TaxID=316055 RepID=Q07PX3_RHOP5
MKEHFGNYITRPFSHSECANIRSLFGEIQIADANIQVMAEVFNRRRTGQWHLHFEWPSYIEVISFGDLRIPLLKLEYERKIALITGNRRRAKFLKPYSPSRRFPSFGKHSPP